MLQLSQYLIYRQLEAQTAKLGSTSDSPAGSASRVSGLEALDGSSSTVWHLLMCLLRRSLMVQVSNRPSRILSRY